MFFGRAISILHDSGHEVLCTSRQYREAVELARIKKLKLTIVGRHGGADRFDKLQASAERTLGLTELVGKFEPDVAVSFSSPEASRVAFGLGTRHVGFNDSPHAEAVARLTVPLMSRLLCPWIIPYAAWTRYGILKARISRYKALDAAAWIKHENHALESHDGKKILIRLEESKASYIADKGLDTAEMVDSLVESLSSKAEIQILCRYDDQVEAARERYGNRAEIISRVVDGVSILRNVDLFVGSGGTMNAEAALLGIPTVSIAPLRILTDDYLIKSGLVRKAKSPKSLARLCKEIISNDRIKKTQQKKAKRILSLMEDPTERMVSEITSA